MTKILDLIGTNTITILAGLFVFGFLFYYVINTFKREIIAYIKKKFDLYDNYEVVSFARKIAEQTKNNPYINHHNLTDLYEELNQYKKQRNERK